MTRYLKPLSLILIGAFLLFLLNIFILSAQKSLQNQILLCIIASIAITLIISTFIRNSIKKRDNLLFNIITKLSEISRTNTYTERVPQLPNNVMSVLASEINTTLHFTENKLIELDFVKKAAQKKITELSNENQKLEKLTTELQLKINSLITNQEQLENDKTNVYSYLYNIPENILITNSVGLIQYANYACCKLLDTDEKTISQNYIYNIVQLNKKQSETQFLETIKIDTITDAVLYQNKEQTNFIHVQLQTKTTVNQEIIIVIKNQTKIVELEHKLLIAHNKVEESDRLKNAFLSNISHEIRTPLNGILGFSDLLKTEELPIDKQHEYLDIIQKRGTQLLDIINNIIDISKIESQQLEIDIEPFNINGELESIFKSYIENIPITISLHLNKGLPDSKSSFKTDKIRFTQIFTNLIENAIKFTKQGKIVIGYSLVTNSISPYLEFYVSDTGIGISTENINSIFKSFHQIDTSLHREIGGAGIGLALCKGIVKLLGGNMWVQSELGVGTTFYFTLPINTSITQYENDTPIRISSYTNLNWEDKTILIVEDDEISSKFLDEIILKTHAHILHAQSGAEGVAICKSNPNIDMILMDIQLPQMNGYEATKQIREFRKNIPIIAQTAFALTEDIACCKRAGCNDCISKPIQKDILISKMLTFFDS